MKVHYSKIAKLLGVKLNDSFCIKSSKGHILTNYYAFTRTGLMQSHDKINWKTAKPVCLTRLFDGVYSIVHIPWKPVFGENYFVPDFDAIGNWVVKQWIDDSFNDEHYEKGIVCKTPEEAIEMAKKMLAAIKEK